MEQVLHPRYSRDADDKFILGKLLNVKRSDKQPLPLYMHKGVAAQAKRRYQNDATYDRIITRSELNSRKCCFIITHTAQESSKVLHNVDGSLLLERLFVLWRQSFPNAS